MIARRLSRPASRATLRIYPAARINADTKREAVREYLDDAARRGAEAPWQVVSNQRGVVNKVVFTEDGRSVFGWYCYLVSSRPFALPRY